MLEKIIISIIIAGAVYYLYHRFKAVASDGGTSCGCGCEACSPAESECDKKTLL